MRIVKQSWSWVNKPEFPLVVIETAGRTCYKSEDKITKDSAMEFVKRILTKGHESVIEHASASVRFITNRGVTHELVRHRLCSFSQESTRYVRYNGKMMEFILPVWWENWSSDMQNIWTKQMEAAEIAYLELLKNKALPEQCREVLPNSLKTEIVVTANLREWRHIFKLRTSNAAHPQMRALMTDCLTGFQREIPVLFDNILKADKDV
ncbi:MAG: FAD-dependent thymidylate synthase [Desulfobacterales bacterium]|nr:FAD-dependent thymidylate synthase [Desulfobacterales bacterium]